MGETEERESMGDGLSFPLGLVDLFLWVGGFCYFCILHMSLEEFLAVKDCVSVTYGVWWPLQAMPLQVVHQVEVNDVDANFFLKKKKNQNGAA